MTLLRQHPYVTVMVSFVGAIAAITMGFLGNYYHNLHPKLVYECRLDYAKGQCPEVAVWVRERNPWERVPESIAYKIYDKPIPNTRLLIATYENKIVRFVPYTFHAVKGDIVTEKGISKTLYFYTWNKRYAPMAFAP